MTRRPKQKPPHGADEKGKKYRPRYAVAVECAGERDQKRLYHRLTKMGLTAKVLVL